ncbi:hypothetical protein MANES_11G015824v8 [Manihot esculenta]|uniref:Uncharacterized protein n=1 Tax=Manihot esculenta TaxID=3983 RepID=A0ACB7GWV8_MANES|nr:hypothetical protein MANES_11G015824v8 [Manihot esculenta]
MASVAYSIFILSLFVFTIVNLHPVSSEFDEYFFIFGDGLYDSGNTEYIIPDEYLPVYHSPYGNTYFKHGTGRYSDGRLIPDFIAHKVGFPDFIPPALNTSANFTYGANFASEGASVFDIQQNNSLNFRNQVRHFIELIKEWRADLQNITEVNRRLKKAVLLINIGTPDILNANITSNTTDAQLETITTEVIGNISDKIKVLYDLGARKFVFQTPPPLGFLPYVKQTRNDSIISVKLNIVALLVVDELYAALMEIKQLNPAFNFTIFGDFFPIFWRVLLPPLFGFNESRVACCGNGTVRGQGCGVLGYEYCVCGNKREYLFFDGTHYSEATNKQLVEMMWDKKSGFIFPYGVKDFFEISNSTSLKSAT